MRLTPKKVYRRAVRPVRYGKCGISETGWGVRGAGDGANGIKLFKTYLSLFVSQGDKIIEAEACPSHIHLFVEIPPEMLVLHFMCI